MLIKNWMSSPVETVKPLDSVAHARQLVEERRINQLPVVVNGRIVGIVTDRDLRDAFPSVLEIAFTEQRRRPIFASPEGIAVELVMTRKVLTLSPRDTVERAAQLMRRERIGAVPIVEGEKLVGILARSDVLDAYVAAADRLRALQPEAEEAAREPAGHEIPRLG